MLTPDNFVHLHVHSHFSLLDGFGTPKNIIKQAKEHGSPAIALTDHGVLYGAIDFYNAGKEQGVNPIIGCEVYIAPGSRFDRTPGSENKPFHLILLATSKEGYENLMLLVTKANLEGFYYKPRMDHGLLQAHSKGLIALSSCLAGEVARSIAEGDEKKQLDVIARYQDIFGKDNFFLELQDHPMIDEQKVLNKRLVELSQLTGAPLVATHDSHYIRKEDALAQDILLCIQTQSSIGQENRMKFDGDFSLRTPEDMIRTFAEVPQAIQNTLEIARRCDIQINFGQNLIPKFKTPNSISAGEYLRELCEEGLRRRYPPEKHEQAQKQLDYELSVVDRMGFNDYFLIVWDFVRFAKDSGITVGPGRGSAAGSIITYTMNITELDPLRYGLIFERFLNPERISMPDIDIDFADNRRDEVLNYVREKYGRENVAQIITFGTMAAKAAVRDVGRAMGYPYAEVDRVAKLIPMPVLGKHAPLKDSVMKDPALNLAYKNEPRVKELLDNAVQLEGTVRHAGTHASAVVMSEKPLVNYTPLQRSTGGSEEIITQYSMKITEDLGLLKMDFLGLKNLTIMQQALELIKQTKGQDVRLEEVPMDDEKAFQLLQKGDTTGIFQLESGGMRRYIRELKPTRFEDIIAMISLYRPGPMEWIPAYIKGKHFPETVKFLDPSFEDILKETNGVAIYQEQILQIARVYAGFSLGEADLLRKAVGKKDPKLLQEQKTKFIEDAVKNNHTKKAAEEVFEKVIEPFAGYGFNKAHAACYAMISYRTAYLKAHYPAEFMAALMSCDSDNTDRIVQEIMECEEMGISVLPPAIEESYVDFTVVNDQTIRFGLGAIKGLGVTTIEEILKVRAQSKFESIEDILKRVPVKQLNKKTIEALAWSGALDTMGERRAIAESYEEMVKYAKNIQEVVFDDQTDIFGTLNNGADFDQLPPFKLPALKPASLMERLNAEKNILGMYVSTHPLKGLKRYLGGKVHLVERLKKTDIGKTIKIGGLITKMKKVMTKAGQNMMYGELEDPTGRIEFVVFPKVYNDYQQYFQPEQILILEGKIEQRGGNVQFSCFSAKAISLDSMIANAKEANTYDPTEKIQRKQVSFSLDPIEKKAPEAKVLDPLSSNIENNFVIEIPLGFPPEKLAKLKELLISSPGERYVELHVQQKNEVKKVKTPMKIQVTPEFELALQNLLT